MFGALSIRQRLFRLVLLTSALVVLVVAGAVLAYESGSFRPRALRQLQDSSQLLRQVLPAALDFSDQEAAASYLRTYAEATRQGVAVAAVYDARGALFASYAGKGGTEAVPTVPMPPGHVVSVSEIALCEPLRRGRTVVGHLYLVEELPPLLARLPQYSIMAGATLLTLLIVGVMLTRGVRKSFLAPLSALLETTTTVTRENDYRVRAAVGRNDELGQLAAAFNRMLETIEQRDTALREAANRLKTVFDATTEVAIIATDTRGLVTVFNTGAERMLGYTAEEIVGKVTPLHWKKAEELERRAEEIALQPDERKDSFSVLTALALRGLPDNREWTFVRKDRTEVKVLLYITAMRDSAGMFVGFLGVASDLSQRKQAQAERERLQTQLIQAQKMEAVGQLAGGVAHDFNNILAAMMLHLDLLLSDPKLGVEMRIAVGELQDYAKRASNLTRQLLLFSRRQVTQMQLLDLDSLLGNLLKMLRRLIGENISIELKGAPKAAWIEADSGMIEQVVLNLVVNARDAISGAGRITIFTELVELDAKAAAGHPEGRPGRFVRLGVVDTGCGMDEATQRKIFEPFFTTKEAGKGTGLGLATVYGIVKRHEGWLEVTSAMGEGSTFVVYLPAAGEGESCATTDAVPRLEKQGEETLFLVEDDTAVRKLAAAVLQAAGYQVVVAANARECLAQWDTIGNSVALLLTDMVMPEEVTGLELARQLQRRNPGLKAIVMSGYSLELSNEGVFADDRIAYFPKPFEAAALARFVRQCLDAR